MRNYLHLFFFIISVLFGFISCKEKFNKTGENLIGKWFLLSSSIPEREYQKNSKGEWREKYILKPRDKFILQDTCSFLIFKNSTDYIQSSTCGDVHQEFKGKYFVLNNPKRGLLTLTLIPDIYVNGSDTIRTGYINMDIIRIQNDSLILVKETTWFKDDSLPAPRFDFKHIYKKLK